MDFTPLAVHSGTMGFQAHAGGSPANVAVGLARLGARVEFAGKVSTDFFGRFLMRHLEREGVGTRFLSRSPAHSPLAFVAFDQGDPSFTFYGTGTADTQLRSEDLPRSIDESDVLHFGSISLLAAPTSETVLALVDRLRGNCLLSLDPNVRPSLIGDPDAYRRTLDRAFRAADILKVSTEDLRWLKPGHSVDSAAAQLLALGPVLVIVTLGRNGCYARMATREIRVLAPRVDVADTVGAGDAFSSGLLACLATGVQKFADHAGPCISVCHFRPGASKWNKIEQHVRTYFQAFPGAGELHSHQGSAAVCEWCGGTGVYASGRRSSAPGRSRTVPASQPTWRARVRVPKTWEWLTITRFHHALEEGNAPAHVDPAFTPPPVQTHLSIPAGCRVRRIAG